MAEELPNRVPEFAEPCRRWSRMRKLWLSLLALIPDLGLKLLTLETKLRPKTPLTRQRLLAQFYPHLGADRLERLERQIQLREQQSQLHSYLLFARRHQDFINLVDWPHLGSLLQEFRTRPVILCFWHIGPDFSQLQACHCLGLHTYAMLSHATPEAHISGPVESVSPTLRDGDISGLLRTAIDRLQSGHLVLTSVDHPDGSRLVPFLGTLHRSSKALPHLANETGAAVFPLTARTTPEGRRLVELGPEISSSDDIVLTAARYFENWLLQHPEEIRLESLLLTSEEIGGGGRLLANDKRRASWPRGS